MEREGVGLPRLQHAHIWEKTPEDVFTVRPNVDRARKEPSKMKWMSASNVCVVARGTDRRRKGKDANAVTRGGCQRRQRKKNWRVRTSQMKVTRSCHGAFLGSSARAAVDATSPMPATPAREYADVAVKTDGGWVDSSIVAGQWSRENSSVRGPGAVGSKAGRDVTMVRSKVRVRRGSGLRA